MFTQFCTNCTTRCRTECELRWQVRLIITKKQQSSYWTEELQQSVANSHQFWKIRKNRIINSRDLKLFLKTPRKRSVVNFQGDALIHCARHREHVTSTTCQNLTRSKCFLAYLLEWHGEFHKCGVKIHTGSYHEVATPVMLKWHAQNLSMFYLIGAPRTVTFHTVCCR